MILFDCSNICYRAAFQTGQLDNGVIYGFFRQVVAIADKIRDNRLVFTWDSRESKRKKLFPDYKAKRNNNGPSLEEHQFAQFDQLRERWLPRLGLSNNFQAEGYEADDIMAWICKTYLPQDPEERIWIVSSDEDLYQLLYRDWIKMWKPGKNEVIYTEKDLEEEYGITAEQWAYVKGIAGCSTDNVPGLKSIGAKTAARYLSGKLPKNSKAYTLIEKEKEWVLKQNLPLVKLPFSGYMGPVINQDVSLDPVVWELMLKRLGFKSMIGQRYWLIENSYGIRKDDPPILKKVKRLRAQKINALLKRVEG